MQEKDVREIAEEFYFDLDNKTNFTILSVTSFAWIYQVNALVLFACLNKDSNAKLFERQ